jgi:hypothetical protein
MAEKKVIELEVKTNAQSLKSQLREAQNEVQALSDKFGAASAQAINAAKRAAELKDAIADAKDLTDAFNPDAKFNALSSSIGGVVSGFEAYEGALGLVGVESAALQEQLLKVQSAMALSQGLQGLGEARDSFKQLGAVAKNVFASIKGALGATGIGLLVIAVSALVSNWKELTGWVEKSFPSFKKIGDFFKNFSQVASGTLDAVIAGFKTVAKVIGDVFRGDFSGAYEDAKKVGSNIANAYNKGFEEKDKEIKQNAFLKSRKFELDLLEAKGKDVADRQLRLMGAELKMLEKGSEEYNAKLIEIEEARTKIREDAAEKQKVIDDKKAEEKKKADEKEKERIKKEKDDALANNIAQQDLVEEQLQAIENAENEYYKNKKTARQQDLDDVNNKYFQLIETAKQNNIDTNILLEAQLKEEQIIKDKYKKEAQEKEGQALYNYYQGVIKTNKQIRDDDKLTADTKWKLVRESLNVIGDLATSFAGKSEAQQKKAFEIQKAANIAGAVIDSIRATMGAWKSGNVIGGPVLGGIQAGLAAASGAIMIRKLEQQTFKGKGDTTAPMPSANGGGQANQVITPNFNIIGAQNQTQLSQLNQAPIKAYVVGSDVTTQQMLDKKKIQNATL